MAGNVEREDQRHLSLRLYEVLEKVGASEKMRNLHKRTSTTHEILETVACTLLFGEFTIHTYICGSSYEGSITPDISSDIDEIVCHISPPAVLDQRQPTPWHSLLVVTDAWTYPGYVKLQEMLDGRPLTVNNMILTACLNVDTVGRVCRPPIFSGHGSPALKSVDEKGVHTRDQVAAFKCNTLPLFASNRLDRLRQRRIISVEEFDKLHRMGCMFVGAGYFLSIEREIEWRLSFSLQERHLMSKLNPTQHKVYILLKIIKVNIIEKAVKCKVFTSYHCKTCVLYAIEMTPSQAWTPDNLINCLMQCIKLLILWLRNNYCPNYFNKNQNLFSKRNFSYFRQSLLQTMQLLLRSNNKYLQLLKTDHIWPILLENECQWRNAVHVDMEKYEHMHSIKLLTITRIGSLFQYIMHILCGEGQYSASSLNDALKRLQQTDTITEHTTTETQSALGYLYPWIHLHIAKSLTCLSFGYHDRSYTKRILKVVDTQFRKAEFTDLVNVRLAKATILYKVEQYETCFRLLQQTESDFTHKVRRMCPCVCLYSRVYRDEQDCKERKRKQNGMSLRKVIKYYTAYCVVFLPSQFQIVPPPLEYEMFRSFGTQPGSRNEREDFWFDFSVIDAKVFLYFLQYLVCTKLHLQAHKQVAMDNIRAVIEEDNIHVLIQYGARQLGHIETAYNLLGWIYMQEQRYGDAMHCFLKSWKIRPFHNAAKFHMRDVLVKLSQRRG